MNEPTEKPNEKSAAQKLKSRYQQWKSLCRKWRIRTLNTVSQHPSTLFPVVAAGLILLFGGVFDWRLQIIAALSILASGYLLFYNSQVVGMGSLSHSYGHTQLRIHRRHVTSALVVGLWGFGASGILFDGWVLHLEVYFQTITALAVMYILLVAFRIDRLVRRTAEEEEITLDMVERVGVFRERCWDCIRATLSNKEKFSEMRWYGKYVVVSGELRSWLHEFGYGVKIPWDDYEDYKIMRDEWEDRVTSQDSATSELYQYASAVDDDPPSKEYLEYHLAHEYVRDVLNYLQLEKFDEPVGEDSVDQYELLNEVFYSGGEVLNVMRIDKLPDSDFFFEVFGEGSNNFSIISDADEKGRANVCSELNIINDMMRMLAHLKKTDFENISPPQEKYEDFKKATKSDDLGQAIEAMHRAVAGAVDREAESDSASEDLTKEAKALENDVQKFINSRLQGRNSSELVAAGFLGFTLVALMQLGFPDEVVGVGAFAVHLFAFFISTITIFLFYNILDLENDRQKSRLDVDEIRKNLSFLIYRQPNRKFMLPVCLFTVCVYVVLLWDKTVSPILSFY